MQYFALIFWFYNVEGFAESWVETEMKWVELGGNEWR